MSEIIIRLRNGKDYDILAKSGLFITVDNFKNEDLVVNRRKVGNDVEYHEAVQEKLEELKRHILNSVNGKDKELITKEWLTDLIDRFVHPEKYKTIEEKEQGKSFFELFDEFLADKSFSNDRKRGMQVLKRDVWRYMKFQQEVCKRQDFTFNVNDVTKDDIDDFRDYLENEKTLMARHKRLFKQMIDEQPNGIRKGHSDIEVRGLNTIVTLMKKLRSFFSWCYEKGKTKNRPFDGVKIGSEKYGTPYLYNYKRARPDCKHPNAYSTFGDAKGHLRVPLLCRLQGERPYQTDKGQHNGRSLDLYAAQNEG